MPGRIPERWEAYNPMGQQIPGTRFICFKVPLSEQMCQSLSAELKFTPACLLAGMGSAGHDLGLVIDMTNTDRYYKPAEITSHDIQYRKIMCPGKIVPGRAVRIQFFQTVDKFLKENSDNDKLIGVHCTHGLNRTGHLVCRYLIDRLSFSPEDAIRTFNDARGYEMEREPYIQDLKTGVCHESPDYVEPDIPPDFKDRPYPGRSNNSSWRSPHNGMSHDWRHDQSGPPRDRNHQYNRPQAYGRQDQAGYGSYGRGPLDAGQRSGCGGYGQYGRRYPPSDSYNHPGGDRGRHYDRQNNSYDRQPGGSYGRQQHYGGSGWNSQGYGRNSQQDSGYGQFGHRNYPRNERGEKEQRNSSDYNKSHGQKR